MKGSLYVIAAHSGAGKTSLVRALTGSVPDIGVSVSHTTRARRPGEEHGTHYFFTDRDEFVRMAGESAFLEHAEVFGNYYGTSRAWVDDTLRSGRDVILEIDWQGAQQVRRLMPEAVGIFILPPSKAVLRERLVGRSTDAAEVIERRLAQAAEDMTHYSEFDYVVVNDDFETAVGELRAIVTARRCRVDRLGGARLERIARLLSAGSTGA